MTHYLKGKPYFFPLFFFLCKVHVHCRCGSRINTDRFPTRASKAQAFRGVRGHAFPGAFLDFNSLKSSFLGFRVIQTGYWLVPFTLDEAPQLGKFFLFIKNISTLKNLTDFRKTAETGVDPRLQCMLSHLECTVALDSKINNYYCIDELSCLEGLPYSNL